MSIYNLVIFLPVLMTQLAPYTFAGLSPQTTMAELKTRYPRSLALNELIYLAAEESHDHVSRVALSTNGVARTLTVTFEREQPEATARTPCAKRCCRLSEADMARRGTWWTLRKGGR